jgi:lipoprotein-anchoring transpeptidase ErfK/SrfK
MMKIPPTVDLEWSKQALRQLERFDSASVAIIVQLNEQQLYLFKEQTLVATYPVSTSKYGIGCQQDSQRTPTGVHRIAKKIGQACQPGEIIKGRRATGEIADIITDAISGEGDVITSRILWLEGMEPGVNQGEGVDSFQRFIYIHGTNEEGLIGQPASHGCIRMRNVDVVELFGVVDVGVLVSIVSD